MDYSYTNAIQYRQTQKLIQDVMKAINGEYSAIFCYERLARLAMDESVKKQIMEIREDEIRHYHNFSQIYSKLTGQKPQPQLQEGCPSTYQDGLRFAFLDEQKTVDFYMEIARETNDPNIKETFQSAAADEQNHAVWFLYFMK